MFPSALSTPFSHLLFTKLGSDTDLPQSLEGLAESIDLSRICLCSAQRKDLRPGWGLGWLTSGPFQATQFSTLNCRQRKGWSVSLQLGGTPAGGPCPSILLFTPRRQEGLYGWGPLLRASRIPGRHVFCNRLSSLLKCSFEGPEFECFYHYGHSENTL